MLDEDHHACVRQSSTISLSVSSLPYSYLGLKLQLEMNSRGHCHASPLSGSTFPSGPALVPPLKPHTIQHLSLPINAQ